MRQQNSFNENNVAQNISTPKDSNSLTKNSTQSQVVEYYKKVVKLNERRLKHALKSVSGSKTALSTASSASLSTIDDAQVKGLFSQLKKDVAAIIVYHPSASTQIGLSIAENLWRTCFYLPITLFRKFLSSTKTRKSNQKHIKGQYLQLLTRGCDFYAGLASKLDSKIQILNIEVAENQEIETHWRKIVYCCAIWQGDLQRYREMCLNPVLSSQNFSVSEEFYTQATHIAPEEGHAFNQLATLAMYRKNYLSAASMYARALLVAHPFQTANDNLNILLTKHVLKYPLDVDPTGKPNSTFTLQSALNSATQIFAKLLAVSDDNSDQMILDEYEILQFEKLFSQALRWKSVSQSISISLVVLFILTVNRFVELNLSCFKPLCLMEKIVKVSFKHLETLKAENQDINGPSLMFLSLITDFISSKTEVLKLLNVDAWSSDSVNDLASGASLTALVARHPLPEEKLLEGFLPFKPKFDKFLERGRATEIIKEKSAGSYRAKKITHFVEEMRKSMAAKSEPPPQPSNSLTMEFSQEAEGSDSNWEDEILLQPQQVNGGLVIRKQPDMSLGVDPKIVDLRLDLQEGLLTGYDREVDLELDKQFGITIGSDMESFQREKSTFSDCVSDCPPPGF